MRKCLVLILVVIAFNASAQNYWSISLPLLNFQRVSNVFNTNDFGVHYESINSYNFFSAQLLRSNKWGTQFNIRSCAGQMKHGGLNKINGAQNINFTSYRTKIWGGYEDSYIRRYMSYNISDIDYYFDFELLFFKGFTLVENNITFRNLEFIIGGGPSVFYSAPISRISYLQKDENDYLYGTSYSFSKFPLGIDIITGLEIYSAKHFHLSLRVNASYMIYDQQSVTLQRLSGVASFPEKRISDNFSSTLLLGGQASLNYHLNLGKEKPEQQFKNGIRKLIFRY